MSNQEQVEVLEDGLDEAKVPHTGGEGVPAAEVPEPVAKSAGKRKADKDGGEKATPKLPGTKAGMLAAMMNVMSGKKMKDLQSMYTNMNNSMQLYDKNLEKVKRSMKNFFDAISRKKYDSLVEMLV